VTALPRTGAGARRGPMLRQIKAPAGSQDRIAIGSILYRRCSLVIYSTSGKRARGNKDIAATSSDSSASAASGVGVNRTIRCCMFRCAVPAPSFASCAAEPSTQNSGFTLVGEPTDWVSVYEISSSSVTPSTLNLRSPASACARALLNSACSPVKYSPDRAERQTLETSPSPISPALPGGGTSTSDAVGMGMPRSRQQDPRPTLGNLR
jgi:hypothetical protein